MDWKDYITMSIATLSLLGQIINLHSLFGTRLSHLSVKDCNIAYSDSPLYDLNIIYLKEERNVIADSLFGVNPLKADRLMQPTENIILVHHIMETIPAAEDRLHQFCIATQIEYSATHAQRLSLMPTI